MFAATGVVLGAIVIMVRLEVPFLLLLVLPAGALVATLGARSAVNRG